MTLNPWEIAIENGLISAYLHGTLDIDGLLSAGSGVKIPTGQQYEVGTDRAYLNTEAVTHAALDTGVHGAGGSTLATVANIATHVADTTAIHGIPDTSKLTVIGVGSYTGDDTANRARSHGLGVIPKHISVVFSSGGGNGHAAEMITSGYITRDIAGVRYSVTAWNSTNFYVGHSGSWPSSLNGSGYTYSWIAIG